MYVLTDEDRARIDQDLQKIHETIDIIQPITEKWADEHVACVALSRIMESQWLSLVEEHPFLIMLDAITGGTIQETSRMNSMMVFVLAHRLGLEGYHFHQTPCSQAGPGHLHDVEDLFKEEGE